MSDSSILLSMLRAYLPRTHENALLLFTTFAISGLILLVNVNIGQQSLPLLMRGLLMTFDQFQQSPRVIFSLRYQHFACLLTTADRHGQYYVVRVAVVV